MKYPITFQKHLENEPFKDNAYFVLGTLFNSDSTFRGFFLLYNAPKQETRWITNPNTFKQQMTLCSEKILYRYEKNINKEWCYTSYKAFQPVESS